MVIRSLIRWHHFTLTNSTTVNSMLTLVPELFSRSQYRDYGAASLSKHFTGRDILLQEMEDRFFRGEKIQDSSKIIVLHGPGGIGKSQIAQRYARSKESHYDFVCVVSCESRQAVERALTDFAINVLRDPPSEQSACLSRLRIGLSECKKSWLFVFDGYDSASRGSADWFSIDRYFPTPPIGITGHILITSVYEGASDMGEGLMIATFSPREARELLLSVSGLADAGVREEDIDEICNQLGRIPLAVDVAGSYLRQQHKGGLFLGREQSLLKTYRHHFNTAGDEFKSFLFSDLVSMPSGNYSYYRTVYKAWKLSFDGVRSINTAAADLFLLLSFLDPKVVSSESAYVRSAFASRPVWNLDGKIEILKPGYRTLPAWLCTLVGSQEVSDDGELGIGSVSIQSATDLLASYSMMRKMIHFGNGYEVWTSHGVFWDCARIYCNQNMTTEMSSTAIDLLLYNRGGVVTSSALFRPDEYISVSSWFLLETILADHIFLPCKTIIGEICDWDKILKSLAAALPSKHATDINLNMLEVRDGLAFLAVTIGHRLEGLDFSSVDISACKAGAAALRDSVFTINALSVLYLLYRIEYLTSGRGLNNPNQEPSELVGFEEISLLLNELKTPDVLESWDTVNGLLLIGTLLVALHRLFVFNETDDNPSLIWKSDTVQKLRQRWLDLRHTTILRKYASKTERHIMQLRGSELLRRARARLFITFARELDKIPRHSFEVSTAFSQVRRKYSEFLAEDILFLNILALHDLEEIGIHHLCALGGSTYLAFDFCGFLFRLEAKRPKFREEAKDKLKSQLDAVSRCIGREIQIELLQELVTNFISPRSAAMHRNCVGCNRVWTSYNLDIQHQSVEAGATLLVSTWRRNMISLLRKALEIVQNLNRALDRYETSAKVVQYTDREQVEKVIDKFKEQYQKLFRKLDFGHFLCNFAAAIEADRHELLSDISSTGLTDVDKAQVELYRDEVEHQLQDLGPIETEELTIALKNAMTRLGMSLEEFLEDRHDSQLLTKGFLEHFEKSLSGQNLSTRFAWLSRRTKNRRSGLRLLTESSNRHMSTLVALESSTSTQAEMDALTAERTARLDKLTVWHNFERAGYLVDFITQKLDLSGIVG